jgi:hypothetical protein
MQFSLVSWEFYGLEKSIWYLVFEPNIFGFIIWYLIFGIWFEKKNQILAALAKMLQPDSSIAQILFLLLYRVGQNERTHVL